MKENKDIYTIGRFNWKSGSINSNIIAMAKAVTEEPSKAPEKNDDSAGVGEQTTLDV